MSKGRKLDTPAARSLKNYPSRPFPNKKYEMQSIQELLEDDLCTICGEPRPCSGETKEDILNA